ncbi:MAG: hypothetical protein AAGI37_08950 [Planctomycetota bacterium]
MTIGEYAEHAFNFLGQIRKLSPGVSQWYADGKSVRTRAALLRYAIKTEKEDVKNAALNSQINEMGLRLHFHQKDFSPEVFISMNIGSQIPGLGNVVSYQFTKDAAFEKTYRDTEVMGPLFQEILETWQPEYAVVGNISVDIAVGGTYNPSVNWWTYVTKEVSSLNPKLTRKMQDKIKEMQPFCDGLLIKLKGRPLNMKKESWKQLSNPSYTTQRVKDYRQLTRRVFDRYTFR